MKSIKHSVFKVFGKLRRRFPALEKRRKSYKTVHVSDLPDKLASNHVYVVGENGHLWSAALKCPGGCGQVLEINLVPDMRPLWHLTERDGNVTIEPSIWRKKDCGCHFRIRHGRVIWY